jgi:hypothetical protein
MRLSSLISILIVSALAAHAQPSSFVLPSNACSCDSLVNYSYDDSTQTHNYSGNWDFDEDYKTDSFYFIGTGGAHLYYYLRIILSSDGKVRNYPYLETEWPCPQDIDSLKKERFYPAPYIFGFTVDDFDHDGDPELFIYLDQQTFAILPKKMKKKGLTSPYILMDYKEGGLALSNFF